ncbi:MAG: hypothetical protein JWO48_2027 [Bryobacterales bacterium]|nr:hypothetical protein [Bryobacterales bacterium]
MRVSIYTVAVPLLTALAFAQDAPPQPPQQPSESPSMAGKTAKDKSQDKGKDAKNTGEMDKDKGKDKGAEMASGNRPEEMKTQTYSGELVDASCAGSSSKSSSSTAAAPSASADRAAPPAGNSSCSVSASTTQFALKLKDGQAVKFDSVGNMRAQEALKNRKKWTESAAASKPIRVKASGVLNGDQLTVISID